jgi:hypothetical protein
MGKALELDPKNGDYKSKYHILDKYPNDALEFHPLRKNRKKEMEQMEIYFRNQKDKGTPKQGYYFQ